MFVGRISYGLYLYHWPLFLSSTTPTPGCSGCRLLAVRLVATFAVAIASFVLIEEPIRTGRSFRGRPGLGRRRGRRPGHRWRVLGGHRGPAGDAGRRRPTRGVNVPARRNRPLAAAGAFPADPIRFLLLGDSVALTLGVGLGVESVARYGVERRTTRALLGCDLDDVEVRLSGVVGPATPGCPDWWATWPRG